MNVNEESNVLIVPCRIEWHMFDWYNGTLRSDEKYITKNASAATATDVQHQQLAGLASNNKIKQLAMAGTLKGALDALK